MAVEIERKFLVVGETWRVGDPVLYRQGYLNPDKHRTVRVRIEGEQAFLTVKGITRGFSRAEYEYEVPLSDGVDMLELVEGAIVEKRRWHVPHAGNVWEVDEFLGENKGLIVAEIELKQEDEQFETPTWLGREVTHEVKYFNSNLSDCPYKSW